MAAALEQVIRPFQTPAPGVALPATRKISPPVLLVILAGSGVKSFTGIASLTTTVYVTKRPKEREF
jgi:hypothetical protein